MKTHLTISELVKRLRIRQSEYQKFRAWCYKNKDKLDTQDCKHNHGYYTYNVKLVSELYRKKHPATTPVEAAEMLGNALSTATGNKVTGSDVLAAFERGKDYIRMRKTMARTLLRIRKERRACKKHEKNSGWNEFYSNLNKSACRDYYYVYLKLQKKHLKVAPIAIVSIILSVISLLISQL